MMRLKQNNFFIAMIHSAKCLKTVGIFIFFTIIFFNNHDLSQANAATLILKNGKAPLRGKITAMDATSVSIENDEGQKSEVLRSQISQIIFNQDAKAEEKQQQIKPEMKQLEQESLTSPSLQDQQLFESLFNGPTEKDMQKGPYVTPKHTFETWRRASIRGDMDAMVKSYAKFRQSQVRKKLKKIPKTKRKEMQEVSSNTIFTLGQVYYQGKQASLEATWNYGLKSDTQTLKFVLEGEDWKLVQ